MSGHSFKIPVSMRGELSGELYPEAAENLNSISTYKVDRYVPRDDTASDGVAIISGGMDSVTLVHKLLSEGHRPHLLSFDYGQRHVKELQYALWTAEALGLHWSLVDLTAITDLISSSALTNKNIEVPEGHYSSDNMAVTVVPNRNMTMLSIAAAVAVSNKYHYVALGIHAGDHEQYPDCRSGFLNRCYSTIMAANEGFIDPCFELLAPFINRTKAEIADFAFELDVPLEMTWSCYKGGDNHCGKCATCTERLEAIDEASNKHNVSAAEWDRTIYEDSTSWRQIVADFRSDNPDLLSES